MLTLLLLLALPYGANRPIGWTVLAIGTFIIFAVQVLQSARSNVPIPVQKLRFPALLFLGVMSWGWIQTLTGIPQGLAHPFWSYVPDAPPAISADPGQGRHAVMRLLSYGMIFITIAWTCFNRKAATSVLIVIALFSTALATFGLYSFMIGNNSVLGGLADTGIVKATFVNRNNYATYADFGVLANLAAAMHLVDRRSNSLRDRIEVFFGGVWIFALGVVICMAAVALTQSRAGAAAGVIGLIVFLTARYSGGRWRGSLMLLLVGATVAFIAITNSAGLLRNYLATSTEDARFTIYPAVVDAILDRPFLGHGLGSFQDAFRIYLPEDAAFGEFLRAHNTYLELAFGLGLPATAALFLALGVIIYYIHRGTRMRNNDYVFSCFALGCVATAAFHSVFDFSLQIPAVAALFAAILGLGYAQSFSTKRLYARVPDPEPLEVETISAQVETMQKAS
jgi:O-antigen ligase